MQYQNVQHTYHNRVSAFCVDIISLNNLPLCTGPRGGPSAPWHRARYQTVLAPNVTPGTERNRNPERTANDWGYFGVWQIANIVLAPINRLRSGTYIPMLKLSISNAHNAQNGGRGQNMDADEQISRSHTAFFLGSILREGGGVHDKNDDNNIKSNVMTTAAFTPSWSSAGPHWELNCCGKMFIDQEVTTSEAELAYLDKKGLPPPSWIRFCPRP